MIKIPELQGWDNRTARTCVIVPTPRPFSEGEPPRRNPKIREKGRCAELKRGALRARARGGFVAGAARSGAIRCDAGARPRCDDGARPGLAGTQASAVEAARAPINPIRAPIILEPNQDVVDRINV